MGKNKIEIVIVDDHNVSIEGMTSILNCLDYIEIVFVASNGKEVLEKLKNKVPDIIFMDVNMPLMNGIEATKEITRNYPQIKIIGISYFSDQIAYVQSMINAGAKGFISKNIKLAHIEEMFTNILDGEIYYSPDISALLLRGKQNNNEKTKNLTLRENEIANLIYDEYSNHEIADKLNIDCRTVETHKNSIMKKIGVKTTAGLIKYIIEKFFKKNY